MRAVSMSAGPPRECLERANERSCARVFGVEAGRKIGDVPADGQGLVARELRAARPLGAVAKERAASKRASGVNSATTVIAKERAGAPPGVALGERQLPPRLRWAPDRAASP